MPSGHELFGEAEKSGTAICGSPDILLCLPQSQDRVFPGSGHLGKRQQEGHLSRHPDQEGKRLLNTVDYELHRDRNQ